MGAICSALRNNKISVVGIEKLRRLINASSLVCVAGSVKSSKQMYVCFSLTPSLSLSQFICAVSVLYRGASIKEKKNDRATVSMGGMQTALCENEKKRENTKKKCV